MKAYDATADIEAGPEAIWDILTDAQGLSSWDSGSNGWREKSRLVKRSRCS